MLPVPHFFRLNFDCLGPYCLKAGLKIYKSQIYKWKIYCHSNRFLDAKRTLHNILCIKKASYLGECLYRSLDQYLGCKKKVTFATQKSEQFQHSNACAIIMLKVIFRIKMLGEPRGGDEEERGKREYVVNYSYEGIRIKNTL